MIRCGPLGETSRQYRVDHEMGTLIVVHVLFQEAHVRLPYYLGVHLEGTPCSGARQEHQGLERRPDTHC